MRPGRRRWVVAGAVALVPLALVLLAGHRGTHAARSLLLPGAGLLEAHPVLAGAFVVAAVAATAAWLRFGTDWIVGVVVVAAMVVSFAWGTVADPTSAASVSRSAHEFPLVVLVVGALGWVRTALGGVPGFRWIRGRRRPTDHVRTVAAMPPVDRCRAASFLALAGEVDAAVVDAVGAPDVARRAARVGLVARWRVGGDPFRVDAAHARAARSLVGLLDADATTRLATDARATGVGAPSSEPGFVRLLDATLAVVALDAAGVGTAADRWAEVLDGPMHGRRGHRPAWWWSPLGVPGGRSAEWEHAAATALAHERGWIGAEDWPRLRRRVLGAAARGSARRDDERLIAAGRMWLALVDDPEAQRVVARPTVRHDPLAVAMDACARRSASVHQPLGGAA